MTVDFLASRVQVLTKQARDADRNKDGWVKEPTAALAQAITLIMEYLEEQSEPAATVDARAPYDATIASPPAKQS